MSLVYTRKSSIKNIVADLRRVYGTGKTRDLAWRKQQLRQLYKLCDENAELIGEAVQKDLHKHPTETLFTELMLVCNDISDALANLDQWAAPSRPAVELHQRLDTVEIHKDPYGVVLIMGAFNYPIQLVLLPLVGALAAGNVALLKPSELSEASAAVLQDLVAQYMDVDAIKVVQGGIEETTKLLEERFDKIMYTGGGAVARIVAAAAARHLTPCCLELGGKSPAIVDETVDLSIVARRVAWGRWLNCGQTCVGVDYVLCTSATLVQPLVEGIEATVREFFGEDPSESSSFGRIVNARHFQRLVKTLEASRGRVAFGGDSNVDDLYIAPTVVVDVNEDDSLMQSEIFGPLLPIMVVDGIDGVFDYLARHDAARPLAAYLFSNDKATQQRFTRDFSFGGGCINDVLMHAGTSALPFGGVGESGQGAYHGKASFDTFTHLKGVLTKKLAMESVNALRYPPYTEQKKSWTKWILWRQLPRQSWLPFVSWLMIAVAIAAFLFSP